MKAKTFENLIRRIVREEIDYALRREIKSLKEDLRDEIKPVIKEQIINAPISSTPVPDKVKTTLKEKIMGKNPIKNTNFKKQNFVSDNTLNDLLNETAQGSTNTYSGNPSANMSQPFSSAGPMPTEAMPQGIAKAVNRDYRELMKAIDKKKGR
jgi:hypothetical protein